jgi:hypothetical protein
LGNYFMPTMPSWYGISFCSWLNVIISSWSPLDELLYMWRVTNLR